MDGRSADVGRETQDAALCFPSTLFGFRTLCHLQPYRSVRRTIGGTGAVRRDKRCFSILVCVANAGYMISRWPLICLCGDFF